MCGSAIIALVNLQSPVSNLSISQSLNLQIRFLVAQLHIVDLPIRPIPRQQFLVRPTLDDLPLFQHQDQVGVLECEQPLRMMKVVRLRIKVTSACWIRCSVSVSTLLVESSRIKMRGS